MPRHLSVRPLAAACAAPMLALGLALVGLAACIAPPIEPAPDAGEPVVCCSPGPVSYNTRDVDLLFVVDNSGSMGDEQMLLRGQLTALTETLQGLRGGLPDLHLGVTSTDLGTGSYPITYCENGGDGGRLLTGTCTNPTGAPYLVDVAPAGCEVTRDATGWCEASSCSPAHCAHEPSTTLVYDAQGCPRCRNYSGESFEDVFSCIASLGTQGCGFEQPLEAMYRALDQANTANAGFLREQALLAVVLLTDEDDCSAADPHLFDNTQLDVLSTLGPLTSFRCFEFGVTCDENDRLAEGPRSGCVPREDPWALLHPVSRYVDFLRALKDPDFLVVAAVAGPVAEGGVTVERDEYDNPTLAYSCETPRGGGTPGIRLRDFVEAFNDAEDLAWAYTSICAPTYVDVLQGVAAKITAKMLYQCTHVVLAGCPDPGAEYGDPVDSDPTNDACRPSCLVEDVLARGLPEETRQVVPPCLEVCPEGPCPGNTDPALVYSTPGHSAAHPAARDPALPVEACWHVRYQPLCEQSRGTELVVSRRADLPPRSFTNIACQTLTTTE